MPALRPGSFLSRLLGPKETRALPPPITGLYSGWGVPPTFKSEQSLEAYGDNVWLYAAVTKIAFEIARTSFKLRRQTKSGEYRYEDRHQALDTLKRPQPTGGGKTLLTGFDLKFVTALHILLPGEGFWVLDRRLPGDLGGAPQRIDVALPHLMWPRVDTKTGELTNYAYRPFGNPESRGELVLDPLDVVHFKMPDPLNLYRGHAPTQGIRYALDTHAEAEILNLKGLQNNAVPSGVLKTSRGVNQDTINLLRTQWNQLYGGSGNSNKVAVVPETMDFQQIQRSNQEMQFVEGQSMNRDAILANYGVGMEMLGKTESQTRANAETAVFVFMKFGVLPYLVKFADTLTNDYLTAFPGTDGLEFCFDDPVPENQEEKRANADSLFGGGALTPNERRKMFGLEPLKLPGMDEPYLPFNVMPVGGSAPPDPLAGSNTNTSPAI